ncbi:MAG: TIGR04540 family protein [Clostridiales bacterium]|nr:TIGR04540 family protein [Eubacteriales bacterium]MDH7567907.1 TIGR04540 family protein [Clostridiales bacterium]
MVQNKTQKTRTDTRTAERYSLLRNPTTVKMLAKQIIAASDDYISMTMGEKEYRELILHYARYHGKKLFSYSKPGELNPTIQNRIGKKRVQLVELMLNGFQTAIV